MAAQSLEYLGTAIVLVAVWLIGGLSIRGQWLMLAAQGVWLAVACMRGMWGLAAQSVVLSVFTVRAIVGWRRSLGRWW